MIKTPSNLCLQLLKEAWGDDAEKDITFPILLRVGR